VPAFADSSKEYAGLSNETAPEVQLESQDSVSELRTGIGEEFLRTIQNPIGGANGVRLCPSSGQCCPVFSILIRILPLESLQTSVFPGFSQS
jgi:hypothetical protein